LLTFVYVQLDHYQTLTQCSVWCSCQWTTSCDRWSRKRLGLRINMQVLFRKGWRRTRNISLS